MTVKRIKTTASLHGLEELKQMNERNVIKYAWYDVVVSPILKKYDLELDRGVSSSHSQYFVRDNAPKGMEDTLIADLKHTFNVQFHPNTKLLKTGFYSTYELSSRSKVKDVGDLYFVVKRVPSNKNSVSLTIAE
jgi:hypothetical protein